MTLMTWTKESFGTNLSIADEQHREIFALVNGLNDAVTTGNRAGIGAKLDALISYVVMHFQTEEKLMQQHGYPEFAAHKAEHDKLVSTCADLQKKFHAGAAEVTGETTGFVRDWLVKHIPAIDKNYGPFFSKKGVT
jgi:hemerythrin